MLKQKNLMAKKKSRQKKTSKKGMLVGKLVIAALVVGLIVIYFGYRKIYKPNVRIELQDKQAYLYVHTGATFEQVLSTLTGYKYLCDVKSFEWMAVKMNYPSHIKPGRYLLKNGMSNRTLLNMLRSGKQVPVEMVLQNARLKRKLASDFARQIEPDSLSILRFLNDDIFLSRFGFNTQTILAMFIPNTYELYWNTSVEDLFERMHNEYKKFWNVTRTKRSDNIGLSPVEVSILASIVEEETIKNDEKPVIAGLYINRIHKGMRMQADPTVRFALGDFSIKRVLDKYKGIDSPYNTYQKAGLPPGPICIPSVASIDAVLNYKQNEYLYMCAREDFSGYHNFARTLDQHNLNAQKYQKALNKARILR